MLSRGSLIVAVIGKVEQGHTEITQNIAIGKVIERGFVCKGVDMV